jgi:hypothetical protein
MKRLMAALVLGVCLWLTGCATFYFATKEEPQAPQIPKSGTLYAGWLDLREDDYAKYGYATKDAWTTEIKRHNLTGIQAYLKEWAPGKTVQGAQSKNDPPPTQGDIFLKFTLNRLEDGSTAEMHVDVEFIEIASQKLLYKGSWVVTSAGKFPRNWKGSSFDGRLDNIVYNLAHFTIERIGG